MEDFLAEGKPWRKVAEMLGKIGIRLPLPVKLIRAEGPWQGQELSNLLVKLGRPDGVASDGIASLFDGILFPKPVSDTMSHAW